MREMIDSWKSWKIKLDEDEDRKNKVSTILNGDDFIMFFKCDDKIFGAPEASRLTFATLMNPEEDDEMGIKDMNFSAMDLIDLIQGKSSERVFSHKDTPRIKIIGKVDALKELIKEKPAKEIDLGTKQKNVGGIGTIVPLED